MAINDCCDCLQLVEDKSSDSQGTFRVRLRNHKSASVGATCIAGSICLVPGLGRRSEVERTVRDGIERLEFPFQLTVKGQPDMVLMTQGHLRVDEL